jgi:hypothetical protein
MGGLTWLVASMTLLLVVWCDGVGGENKKIKNGLLMLGEHYRHYRHYIHIFDIFDLSHIYKMQDGYYITAFELFFLRLQLPSSLWTMWCCRGTGFATCGTLEYMGCQPCLPQIQVKQPSCHHQDTTKRHQDTPRFAQIRPRVRPLGVLICTHLYRIVQYNPN